MEHPCFVGIDVSKAHLDVYVRPSGDSFRVGHDDAGFATLIEVTVAAALAGAKTTRGRGQSREIRDFARVTGQLAKTDAQAQWKTLRTTNVIERLHEEFWRRVKTQGSLPTGDAALVLLVGLVVSGEIRLRRLDGSRHIAVVPSQRQRPAA